MPFLVGRAFRAAFFPEGVRAVRRVPVVALIVTVSATACSLHSGRVHVLGRDYQKSGRSVSLSEAQRASAGTLVIVEHGRVVTGNVGTFAPTVIYVEDGDEYTPYELEGGP